MLKITQKNKPLFWGILLVVVASAVALYLVPSISSLAGGSVSSYRQKPKFTEIYVTGISQTSVAVNFRTDITSEGRVCYSATDKRVGSQAPCSKTTGFTNTFHTVGIGNLSPDTTYYYKIYAKHYISANETVSQIDTFTTLK